MANLWDAIDTEWDNLSKTPSTPSTSSKSKSSSSTSTTTSSTTHTDTIATFLNKPGGNIKSAELRIQADLSSLPEELWFELKDPDPNDMFKLECTVDATEGYWKGGRYRFRVNFPRDYPFNPPIVHCDTLIYHPNIDLSGNVCLSILKDTAKAEGWSPQRSLTDVIFGFATLLTEPNTDDPLNFQAADMLVKDREEFKNLVNRTLRGETVQVGDATDGKKANRKFDKFI